LGRLKGRLKQGNAQKGSARHFSRARATQEPTRSLAAHRHASCAASAIPLHARTVGKECEGGNVQSGVVSQVCGELQLLRILLQKRGEILVIQAHFLAIPHIFVCQRLAGNPADELLGSLRHHQRGFRGYNCHPAHKNSHKRDSLSKHVQGQERNVSTAVCGKTRFNSGK
jgi:hypothetical protein